MKKFLLALCFMFLLISPCLANDFPWEIEQKTFAGITFDGQSILRSKIIMAAQHGQTIFGIPLELVKIDTIGIGQLSGEAKLYDFDDSMLVINKWVAAGRIGISDQLWVSAISIDYPYQIYGGGFIYDWSHWNRKLPPFDFGTYICDNNHLLFTVDGNIDIDDGYWFHIEAELGMEELSKGLNRDYADGRFAFVHAGIPDAGDYLSNYQIEIGIENRSGKFYPYFGAQIDAEYLFDLLNL